MLPPGRQYLAKTDVFYVYNPVFYPLFRHVLTPRKYRAIYRTTMIYTASAIVVTSGRNRSARSTVHRAEIPVIQGLLILHTEYKAMGNKSNFLAVVCLAFLAGCASTDHGNAEYRVDSREELQKLSCPADRTPVCVERIGHLTRCFCSHRDDLEALLEPE
jgi:hypothetical protein